MDFTADFHIHSPFSRATSKELLPENIYSYAVKKGIQVIASGDFTHPQWLEILKDRLIPAEPGLFKLKEKINIDDIPDAKEVRFLLTAEISNIYKKNDRVRKVHSVILAPDFESAEKINGKLVSLGANIKSDGRPIIGMDTKDLLEISLEASEDTFFIPAHIWTPWFSILGSKSGFDSVEECFEDLSKHIYTLETGLSSDIPMNRICSILDKYSLVSNSDAHSLDKLGRNANRFNTDLDYFSIIKALKDNDGKTFKGTIDLFPQEGKYHFDGHRKCNICYSPLETVEHKGICPVCNKPLVVGVLSRVAQLSDRNNYIASKFATGFKYIIPLKEILGEIAGVKGTSKKVNEKYEKIIKSLGSELEILLNIPIEVIKKNTDVILATAIDRMRKNDVFIEPGYDGVYGVIKAFDKEEVEEIKLFGSLFTGESIKLRESKEMKVDISFDLKAYHKSKQNFDIASLDQNINSKKEKENPEEGINIFQELNSTQENAAKHVLGPSIILAGPGTGKTKTLTSKIAGMILNNGISPENILAITFTNKASEEMSERLQKIITDNKVYNKITVSTFHSLGYDILKKYAGKINLNEDFSIIDDDIKNDILENKLKIDKKKIKDISSEITSIKMNLKEESDLDESEFKKAFVEYQKFLTKHSLLDLDDLIYRTYFLFYYNHDILENYRNRYKYILIDEYQDINFSQYKLIMQIMPDAGSNLTVIGDPNQSIYGFRGSDVALINKFANDFPAASVFKLNKTYRCSGNIIKASSNILKLNYNYETNSEGLSLKIASENSDKSEAEFIARQVELLTGGVSFFSMDSNVTDGVMDRDELGFSDIGILCRTKSLFNSITKALNDHRIPFQVVGKSSLLNEEPAKSILSILNIFYNQELESIQKDKNLLTPELKLYLEQYGSKKNISALIKDILEFLPPRVAAKNTETQKQFIQYSKKFKKDVKEFLKTIKLENDIDTMDKRMEAVTIMTIHASKGLEFDAVFIPACEDKIIPYNLYKDLKSDIDEEKRLLYVAMTRAKKYLYLTHAKRRFLNGVEYKLQRSPFLNNIEKNLFEIYENKFEHLVSEKDNDDQLSLF